MQRELEENSERPLNKTTSDVQSNNRAKRFQQTVNDREDTEDSSTQDTASTIDISHMQSELDESIERLLDKTTSDVQSNNRAKRFQQTVNDREDTEVFYNES